MTLECPECGSTNLAHAWAIRPKVSKCNDCDYNGTSDEFGLDPEDTYRVVPDDV